MPTATASRATAILRDGSHFEWHVIPLLLLVLYVYANEIERRSWNVVFAGLALWAADWLNEIGNALLFHATAWAAPAICGLRRGAGAGGGPRASDKNCFR